MRNRMRQIYILLVLVSCSLGAWAQNQSQYINAGDKAFLEKNYYGALSYYLEALEFDSTDVNLLYDAAESARLFSSYSVAQDLYQKVVDKDNENKYPLSSYWLAEMFQMQGNYEQAKSYYQLYLSEQDGENDMYTSKAKKEISSVDWSLALLDQPSDNIQINRLGDEINTENSEFGAVLEEHGITYSSLGFETLDAQNIPAKPITKVMKSSQSGLSEEYTPNFNRVNEHTAHTAYNMNRSKLYYTICQYVNATDIRCDLYSRAILGDGTLGEEMKLPESINSNSHTSTEPNIGFDRASGKEVLYFVSDREGGEGKSDIWYVTIDGVNIYSEPVNLSVVNTAEDEITPFFHNNSQVLYFSSTGYTSLGGFDIYRTEKEGTSFGQIQNLGSPLNSSYNDIYYSLSPNGETGLLSSNRTGAKYIDPLNESCCYDIFEVNISDITITLNALTFDGSTLDSLSGATVQLIDAKTGEVIAVITNDMGSDHQFTLEKGREYLIVSSMDGYTPDTMQLNTNRIYRSEDIVRKVFLTRSSLELLVFTFDDVSKLPLPGTTVRLMDLTDNTIQVVEITNTTAHDFGFKVIPGHRYQLVASKDRFVESSLEFIAQDEEGSGIMTRRLFLARKDLNIYLPLALYFDNDRPGERSMALTTKLDYSSTFDSYVVKKQEFKDEYTKAMSDSELLLGDQRVEDFFQNDVKGGFDKYQGFLSAMLKQLQIGKSFELSIRGFASPRADGRYNLALSQRRVISVENDIKLYSNGALIPFISNGQLKITQLSYGENLAPSNVSDVFYDRRNSVYSPEASLERRVEIVEIKTQLINE